MPFRCSPSSAPAGPPTAGSKKTGPPWPKEHGAWGILLGSFFAASAWDGTVRAPALLLLLSFTGFYFFHPVFQLAIQGKARSADWRWGALFLVAGWTLLLSAADSYRPIVPLSLTMAVFLLIEALLIRQRRQRTFIAQLTGMAGLSVVAPLTVILSRREILPAAGFVWLLVLLFFLSGILFARFQIFKVSAGANPGPAFYRSRGVLIIFHLLLAGGLVACSLFSPAGRPWQLAFAPAILVSLAALSGRFPVRSVKQTGWLIMVQTVLFCVLLWFLF